MVGFICVLLNVDMVPFMYTGLSSQNVPLKRASSWSWAFFTGGQISCHESANLTILGLCPAKYSIKHLMNFPLLWTLQAMRLVTKVVCQHPHFSLQTHTYAPQNKFSTEQLQEDVGFNYNTAFRSSWRISWARIMFAGSSTSTNTWSCSSFKCSKSGLSLIFSSYRTRKSESEFSSTGMCCQHAFPVNKWNL